MTRLQKLQTQAVALAGAIWPDDKPSTVLADALTARLCEETGELARAVRRYGRHRFGHPGEGMGTADDVRDEVGDVMFVVARLATLCGVDLEEAARMAVAKVAGRLEAKP